MKGLLERQRSVDAKRRIDVETPKRLAQRTTTTRRRQRHINDGRRDANIAILFASIQHEQQRLVKEAEKHGRRCHVATSALFGLESILPGLIHIHITSATTTTTTKRRSQTKRRRGALTQRRSLSEGAPTTRDAHKRIVKQHVDVEPIC